jgi:hypothetical protein
MSPELIAPGAPARSVLLARMKSRDAARRMPPISSHVVDDAGVALISQWIAELPGCP